LIKKIDSVDGWREMSCLRKLRSFGAVFAIAPTASIAQEYTITVHPERKYSVDGLAVDKLMNLAPLVRRASMFVNLAINIRILLDVMNRIARMGFRYQGQYCTHLI
jgi:hypothetical protein